MPLQELAKEINGSVSSRLKWQAVSSFLSRQLAAGAYRPGDILPSENQISKSIGVARNTVRQAFAELEKEGLIKRVRGKGTVVAPHNQKTNSQQLEMFALIMPEIRRSSYASLVKGFDVGANNGYHQIMICNTDESVDKQGHIILQLLEKGVAGVAVVPTTYFQTPVQQIRYLQANGVPVVFCHRSIEGVDAPFLCWEWEQVGRIAGEKLIEYGHKQIMYFGNWKYSIPLSHVRALRQILSENSVSLPDDRVLFGPPPTESEADIKKEKLIKTALTGENRPTAVLCSDDTEAERVFWVAHQVGLNVPEDLSIIGFGDVHRDTMFKKLLTSVTVDELHLGKRAASLLCEMRSGDKPIENDETYYMRLQLADGSTLAEVPSKP